MSTATQVLFTLMREQITEQQIRDKLTKDYPIVQKNTHDHGLILTFENQDHTSKVNFYLTWKTCYMIKASAPIRFMSAYINIANRRYERLRTNVWKHQNFELKSLNLVIR
ncbi:MAG TPA: hypothetical protein VGB63_07995 [Pedobacter sp.]|jgi:hypothetical protein